MAVRIMGHDPVVEEPPKLLRFPHTLTDRYRVFFDRFGGYYLRRVSDGASAYFRPGPYADRFEAGLEKLQGNEKINAFLSQYDNVLTTKESKAA
jgi:hypothetical protein